MAVTRRPLPPISRAVTPLEWVLVLVCWFLLDFASAGPLQTQLAAHGASVSLHDLRIAQAIDWALWAVLLPAIFSTLDSVHWTVYRYDEAFGREIWQAGSWPRSPLAQCTPCSLFH
jgi:hypothetical protein